ncbi:cytosol aminopeptidase [Klebsiella michiganensis]|uniref:Cytosol aminopeptidase n=1 Tax=Klebsiella michiganensis TaxID=1134687 RepID=A0A7H4MYY0_9ENTR|nr:cytosol aminopeptidase [Klebsiella michiganensis]
MLDYRLINQLDSACTGAHLVTWPGSTLLAQAPLNAVPLLAEMVEQAARGEVADTRFGCAPFARITLIPRPLWRDTLNDGLAEALRPLCKKPVSETLILDASLEESSGALTKALRELFNLDWQLDDLGLHQVKNRQASSAPARPLRLTRTAVGAGYPHPSSTGHGARHARRAAAGGSACGAVYPAVRGGRSPASVRGYPHAALRSSG